MSLPVIALAGATGHLGMHITDTLLSSPFRSSFSKLILLSRYSGSSSGEKKWAQDPQVQVRRYLTQSSQDNPEYDPSVFNDVDIYISAIGPTGHSTKDALIKVALQPQSKVKLYIPSEFGVDHYVHDFAHPEWDAKKHHFQVAKEALAHKQSVEQSSQPAHQVRICRIFIGLFTEDSVGPWFGFDTKNGKYESVGPSNVKISFTSLGDVARVAAAVATKVEINRLPETLHVAGDSLTITELADMMSQAGAGKVEVSQTDLPKYKDHYLNVLGVSKDPAPALRFLMGEGKISHTKEGLGNDDELVNPEQRYWKWETMMVYAKDNDGKPWSDFPWPPEPE